MNNKIIMAITALIALISVSGIHGAASAYYYDYGYHYHYGFGPHSGFYFPHYHHYNVECCDNGDDDNSGPPPPTIAATTTTETFMQGVGDATQDCNVVHDCDKIMHDAAFMTHSQDYRGGYTASKNKYYSMNSPDVVTTNKAYSDNGNIDNSKTDAVQKTNQNQISNIKSSCVFNCYIENPQTVSSENDNDNRDQ